MCGRYANSTSGEELGVYFEADEVDEAPIPPSWNIAPTQQLLERLVLHPVAPLRADSPHLIEPI